MKKARTFVVVLAALCLFGLSGCAYLGDSVMQDGQWYQKGFFWNRCFAGIYDWDGTTETMEITIPDEIDGCKVVALGGYVGKGAPSAFGVHFTGSDMSGMAETEEVLYVDEERMALYSFTLNIGKNVKEIDMVDSCVFATEGFRAVALFTVNCSEDNAWFYSKDGKLYDRATDAVVDSFPYYSDYEEYKATGCEGAAAGLF